ncbi:MAG: ABC transporter ATP-binding protein [Betaproteobacteria bacterium]|nr:ABC transporter ATP-binding protein [Betaproteobacteria bacterium]
MLGVEQLTITAGSRTLCRELDLAVAPGELWAVLGCNGSGKTTLLHALAGLAPAAAGRVTVADKPLATYSRRELGRTLGILLQREDQEFWGTLADYVLLGRYPHARSLFGWNAPDEEAAVRALGAFDLKPLAAQSYGTLSGGERQRARLAQLWAQNPRLLLLDEPLQHLDLRHQLQTLELVRAAVRGAGKAALVVLHDLTFACRCDRVLMLRGDGRYAAGAAAELLQPERLEDLYGCRVRAFGNGPDAHFIPVI